MSGQKNYHMSVDDFRRYGRAVVDWIADYYERLESLPVLSQVKPGQIRADCPLIRRWMVKHLKIFCKM